MCHISQVYETKNGKKIVKRNSQKTHSLTVLDPKWLTNSQIPLAVLPYLSEFHLFTLECFAGSD